MKKIVKLSSIGALSLGAVLAIGSVASLAQTGTTQETQQSVSKEKRGGRGGKFRGHRGGRGKMGGAMFRGLNLSDEQKTRVKQIRETFRQTNQPLHEQLRAKRQELRGAQEGGTFNEALATQKLTEMASLQAKLMGENVKLRQEMLAILTPEQKTQLEQKRAEREAKRAERKAARADRGGGAVQSN